MCTEGQLTLPSGVSVDWIAHTSTVDPLGEQMFRPSVRVVVTGHRIGGPVYLTGIRAATHTEWHDALDSLTARLLKEPAARTVDNARPNTTTTAE
ncbi:hypothetical protein ACWC4A_52140 [Streptomyces mirabilis]